MVPWLIEDAVEERSNRKTATADSFGALAEGYLGSKTHGKISNYGHRGVMVQLGHLT